VSVPSVFDAYVRTAANLNLACMESAARVVQLHSVGALPSDVQSAQLFMDDTVRAFVNHLLSLKLFLTEAAASPLQ